MFLLHISKVPMKKQVCVIPFKRDFLIEYNKMDPTPLEIIESIDMMRFLDNDISIIAHESFSHVIGVDRPKDLEKVISLFDGDKFISSYSDKYF